MTPNKEKLLAALLTSRTKKKLRQRRVFQIEQCVPISRIRSFVNGTAKRSPEWYRTRPEGHSSS